MSITIIVLMLCVHGIYGDSHHDIDHDIPFKKSATPRAGEEKDYWYTVGQTELSQTLNETINTNVAKNVILFLGDGMSISTVTAARIYKGQQEGREGESDFLSFDKFPHTGLSKTYCVDKQTTDSAASGTAYHTGIKTNYGLVGVDASVTRDDCTTITSDSIVESIAKWSQDAGMRTGFVTSTRVTHATPATLYAHTADRDWECDASIPQSQADQCPLLKDIAKQLVEDAPGNQFNVIMGGGYQLLDGTAVDLPGDPVDDSTWGCIREDNRTLWREWLDNRTAQGDSAQFVRNLTQLNAVDYANTDYLMGIFANDHMPYEYQKREMGLDLPTLAQMTEAAITVLDKGSDGFFLLVEGGKIDWSHHDGQARVALDETAALDDAVLKALEMTDQSDTLIVVTADHSHTMTISGYADRGDSILGTAGNGEDDLLYTTLSYANGPGYNYSVVEGKAVRMDVSQLNTSSWDFLPQAAVPKDTESHGGDDVAIYALGPMSHLFTSVHEENYIAHAMAYASCVGSNLGHCAQNTFSHKGRS